MTTKSEQDRQDQSYSLYEDIRDYIEKNASTVSQACEVFGIPAHRYYAIQVKYKKENIKRKRTNAKRKQEAQQNPERSVATRPTVTTIKYDEEPPVTPELVSFPVHGNDLVFVTVSRAKNVGAILDQILHRI